MNDSRRSVLSTPGWSESRLSAAKRVRLAISLSAVLTAPSFGDDWQPPHMSWGAPDLQGTWSSATISSLERPAQLPSLVLTDAQAAMVEKMAAGFAEANDSLAEGDLPAGGSVGGYNSAWMDPGTQLIRINGKAHSSIIVEPADGKLPYTPYSRQKMKALIARVAAHENPEEHRVGDRCVVGFGSTGGPPMLPVLYNNNYQIVRSPGHVAILVEMNHDVRTIRIDGDRLPRQIQPWLGDSIGHWDGNTLVVTTTGFHPQQSLRTAIRHRLIMSPDSVVIERFTRIGENEIHYEFSVSDDAMFTQDWRGELPLHKADGQIYEYACHEGNYALPNILAGARQAQQD